MNVATGAFTRQRVWPDRNELRNHILDLPDGRAVAIGTMTFYWKPLMGKQQGSISADKDFFQITTGMLNQRVLIIPLPTRVRKATPKCEGEVEIQLTTSEPRLGKFWHGDYFAPAEMFEFRKYMEEEVSGYLARRIPCYHSEKYGIVIRQRSEAEKIEDPWMKDKAMELLLRQVGIQKEFDEMEVRKGYLLQEDIDLAREMQTLDPEYTLRNAYDQAKARVKNGNSFERR